MTTDENKPFGNYSTYSTMHRHNLGLLSHTRFWQYLTVIGVLAIAYWGTARLAFSMLDLSVEASPLWPPAGIALAALLLQGQRVWVGVALGAFLFARLLSVDWMSACTIAGGSALQAWVGTTLLQRMQFHPVLKRLQDVIKLVVLGAWVSPLVNATISTLVGYLNGSVKPPQLQENWWVLWLGDAMGILIFTPLVLVGYHWIKQLKLLALTGQILNPRYSPKKHTPAFFPHPINKSKKPSFFRHFKRLLHPQNHLWQWTEAIICFTLLSMISGVVFGSNPSVGIAHYPLEYLPFPFVVWAALRFSQPGAVLASLIVSWFAIWGAAQNAGPFVAKTGDIYQAILFLHGFMGVVAISALILAAAESERALAVNRLKDHRTSLANAQRLARMGNWDFYETHRGTSIPQQHLHWSDELYRLLGFAPQAFKPTWEAFFQSVHPEDRERVGQAIHGALREHKPYCLDYRLVLPDGSERVVCERSEIYNDGISGTVQDITERHQVEAQLRTATERQRLLGEMALRIRRSLNLEQILNTTVAEVRQFLGADRVFIGQINLLDAQGNYHDLQGKAREQNSLSCFVNSQADTCLQGLVIAESVDSDYPSLRSLIVNDETALGEWRRALSYSDVFQLFEESRVRVIEDIEQLSLPPQIATYYTHFQIKAILGVPIWLGDRLFGALVVNQCDRPRHWQAWEIEWLTSLATQVAIAIQQAQLYRQITDLNTHLEAQVEERTQELTAKMIELQELNQLKDVFLQAVSHDLRTSLLGMSMVLNNLRQSPGETVTLSRPLLERMITSSERQLNLINSLLEDCFNEERDWEVHCEPVQLDQLIPDWMADWQSLLVQNQATLTHDIPTYLPLILADATQLQQVWENLLTNALKHNPPGRHLTLQIRIENQMLRCILQDDGVGMSDQQQKSLFKLYIRGLHTKHLTGIGLGLYKCRQIVQAHGGEIGVISVPDAGSTFWFTLPLTESTALRDHQLA